MGVKKNIGLMLVLIISLWHVSGHAIPPQIQGIDSPPEDNWDHAVAGQDYVKDEVIVGFQHALVQENRIFSIEEAEQLDAQLRIKANQLAEKYNLTLLATTPVLFTALFRIEQNVDPIVLSEHLQNESGLAYAEPNGVQRAAQTHTNDDPEYEFQYWYHSLIGSQRGWDTVLLPGEVRVAVLDSGVRFDHPEIGSNVSRTQGMDFVRSSFINVCDQTVILSDNDTTFGVDANVAEPIALEWDDTGSTHCASTTPYDRAGHGTSVIATLAGVWENGRGGTGVLGRGGGEITIVPIRVIDVIDFADFYDVSQGILYAAGQPVSDGSGGFVRIQEVDVMNMSLYSSGFSWMQFFASTMAHANNVLQIAAAGNTGTANPKFPAAFSTVVAVTALNSAEQLASFSNFGSWIEITAPGDSIKTATYDFSACPVALSVHCTMPLGGIATYTTERGTSLSAPMVSAIAALYKAYDRSLDNVGLRTALHENAVDWGVPGFDTEFGAGLVQMKPGKGIPLATNHSDNNQYQLIDVNTGARYVEPGTGSAYSFPYVLAGDYYLLMASDEDGDGRYGETGEAVGSHSSFIQNPSAITMLASGSLSGNFTGYIGWPEHEQEPANNTESGAGKLFLNGYAQSRLDSVNDVDWFELLVADAGIYRFWTEGVYSIDCRQDLEDMNVLLELYDDSGVLLRIDDDSLNMFCAEINVTLSAGTYYLKVSSSGGSGNVGESTVVHFDRR